MLVAKIVEPNEFLTLSWVVLVAKVEDSPEWAVVVAQLVEWSLPTPEVRSSNPIIGKILSTKLSNSCIIEET